MVTDYRGEIDAKDYTTTRVVVMVENSRLLGFATFDDDSKTLEMVRVNRFCRRQGIGRTLIELADACAGCLLIDNGYRSEEGTKLLLAMKRPMSRLRQKLKPESTGAMMEAYLIGQLMQNKLRNCTLLG